MVRQPALPLLLMLRHPVTALAALGNAFQHSGTIGIEITAVSVTLAPTPTLRRSWWRIKALYQ